MLRAKTQTKNYVDAFAGAVTSFADTDEDALAALPAMLSEDFDADRAELWLWDEASGSCYLTNAAGMEGRHRLDYAPADYGAIGKIAYNKESIENIVLATFGGEAQDFARKTGLTFVSGYPLVVKGEVAGVLAIYSRTEASEELLVWWRIYAQMSSARLQNVLASQEKDRLINQLSVLFEATRLLNSTLDLTELLEMILKIARTEVKADRGSVFLVDHKHNELWSIVASGLDHQEIRIPVGEGVAGRVAKTGEVINVEDAYTLGFFDPRFDQKFNYRTKSLLSLPIRHHSGHIVGVIQLLNSQDGSFSPANIDFLSRLTGHMALALENARQHRDSLEKQRTEKELALARAIQRSLLPESPPIVPGYDIAVLNDPCFEVGGDYFDFLNLGPQSLLLVVADVEGKGVSSALVMSNLQATLRVLVMHLHSLEVLAFSLNEMLYNDTKSGKYLSVFLGLVDTRRNIMHYINAGHVPPVLIRGKSGDIRLLEEGGTVIGLFPTADYKRGSIKLESGDVLACCTDGITEIADEHGHEYGTLRLAERVRRNREKSAQAIVDAVLTDVSGYSTASMNVDDKVLMVMKVTSEESGELEIGSSGDRVIG
ncbi:MAG TPA: SpoIIE family protein phosphatase [Candidatus Solibacter sp.]|nr:SpoIIE family protein phosphatase [Candidatus Solibacter sp.]